MRILVSGVAGDIGFGIGRILKEWKFFDKIYGVDISEDHAASLIFDEVSVAPRADSGIYQEWLLDYLKAHKIDVFVPTSEAEIITVSNNLSVFDSMCKILINDRDLIINSLDKHKTLSYLEKRGLKVPAHGLVSSYDMPKKYPVIIKPRSGQGSKGLSKISSELEFVKCKKGYVWQEYLAPDDEEYTCAVYISKVFKSRILVLKRVLIGDSTGRAVVVSNLAIEEYVIRIIAAWNVPGLYNIQLRLTNDGPKIFEINPRLSSTLVFRHKLGFQDFKWWVLEALGMELPHYDAVRAGTKIYRGNIEYIISPCEVIET